MEDFHFIIDFFRREWVVIRGAWLTFTIALLLLVGMAYLVCQWINSTRDTARSARIDLLKEQLESTQRKLQTALSELTERTNSTPPDRQYHWQMLSQIESSKLRQHLRKLQPSSVAILCGSDSCGDLARSLEDVFDELQWKHWCCLVTLVDIDKGIHLWGETDKFQSIANDIEYATDGRLHVTPSPYVQYYDKSAYPLQIYIGQKPR